MASVFNPKTNSKIQTVFADLATALGVDLNFKFSPGFKVVLQVNPDGESVSVETSCLDQGPNNSFTADANGNPLQGKPKAISAIDIP